MVKTTSTRPRFDVTVGNGEIVNHAGTRLVADMADRVGLTAGLSEAMASTKKRRRGHDRGRVLVDLAVMLADGCDTICDLAVLRDQPELFGEVASNPTAWRTLEAVGPAQLEGIAWARARARAAAWAAGADPGFYVIDIDATLVNSHSDKAGAAGNYKGGFGFPDHHRRQHHEAPTFPLHVDHQALAGHLGDAPIELADRHPDPPGTPGAALPQPERRTTPLRV